MAKNRPPIVRSHPDEVHTLIPQWTVPLRYGDTAVVAQGTLDWVPPGPRLPWVAVTVAGFVAVLLPGLRGKRRTAWIAAALVLLVVVDIVHVTGSTLAVVGGTSTRVTKALQTSVPSLVAWFVGLYGVRRMLGAHEDGPWFGLFGAAIIVALSGVSDTSVLLRSQLPFGLPWWIARLCVALSIGLGAAIIVTIGLVLRRERSNAIQLPAGE